jgi:hypothetical protein
MKLIQIEVVSAPLQTSLACSYHFIFIFAEIRRSNFAGKKNFISPTLDCLANCFFTAVGFRRIDEGGTAVNSSNQRVTSPKYLQVPNPISGI